MNLDTFRTRDSLQVGSGKIVYWRLGSLEQSGIGGVSRLPFSLKILLENLLRLEDGRAVTAADIRALASREPGRVADREIAFTPARVLLQDFTGVPVVAHLAALREAVARAGGDPALVNPLQPVDLVIDHSVQVDVYGARDAYERNVEIELARNRERYVFLRWGQQAFGGLRVVPPGMGICHQVNLEYLARVVFEGRGDGAEALAYPDTLVGTDSHTTMVNGLGRLGPPIGSPSTGREPTPPLQGASPVLRRNHCGFLRFTVKNTPRGQLQQSQARRRVPCSRDAASSES